MYHWKITKDLLEDGRAVGTEGPADCDSEKSTPIGFRLYDDDGELYYEGEMSNDCDGFEPLDDFGTPNAGCTEIRLLEKGAWKTL